MKTHPTKDRRFTVSKEFTGHPSGPRFVVRFCGERIDCRSTYAAAAVLAVGENARRNGALVIECKPA